MSVKVAYLTAPGNQHFCDLIPRVEQQYFMNNQKLDSASNEKDLGIVISDSLKVSQQCRLVYNRASMLGHKQNNRIQTTRYSSLHLCKSLIRPHLEYCVVAWSPHYKKNKPLLEKIQRRSTMIASVKHLPHESRLEQLKLWSLEDRCNRADLIEVFKIHHLTALEDIH